MLAKITEGVPDTLRQLQNQAVLAEFKYDGIRAQVCKYLTPCFLPLYIPSSHASQLQLYSLLMHPDPLRCAYLHC